MIILDVNNISKNFGYGTLFEKVSFSLNEGESISIVGQNGCGKSTLIKIIAGIYKPDSGQVSIKKDASVCYLDQVSSDREDSRLVQEVIKDAFSALKVLEERIKKYEAIIMNGETGEKYEKALEAYSKTIEEYSMLGGYDQETNIKIVSNGLGIKERLLSETYDNLSGGEKTLVQLAKVLIKKPDLLILDEPTNHLDIERIEWLESYIKSFKGACVIVSHDRYFLDKMSNKILDLGCIEPKIYVGNYTSYLSQKEKDFERQMASFEDQQELIKRLEKQIKYFATQGMAKNSSTLCDRAHALQTQLDRILKNKIQKPVEDIKFNIAFDDAGKSSKRIFETKNLNVKLPSGENILKDVNLVITDRERVALIGNNGSGKSTFVKCIMGTQDLEMSGDVFVGPSAKIGYLPQIISFHNEKSELLDYFMEETGQCEEYSRRKLAAFGFYKVDVTKRVKSLSGGEKIRVRLAVLLEQNVNTLVFDEPTNHIDIGTKEMLEKALENFKGTFVFISHDRYFINKFADRIVEFKNGQIKTYIGNFDDYKRAQNLGR